MNCLIFVNSMNVVRKTNKEKQDVMLEQRYKVRIYFLESRRKIDVRYDLIYYLLEHKTKSIFKSLK